MNKYLLSDGSFTSEYDIYLKDAIDLVFNTEIYSIPREDYGFDHNISGVDKDYLLTITRERVQSSIHKIDKNLDVKEVVFDNNSNLLIATINYNKNELKKVNISV